MKTILKYELGLTKKSQGIQMPRDSNILDVRLQDGTPFFWAIVDPDTPMEERRFLLLPTGGEIHGYPVYHGTFQWGHLVYHLFEEFEETELPF